MYRESLQTKKPVSLGNYLGEKIKNYEVEISKLKNDNRQLTNHLERIESYLQGTVLNQPLEEIVDIDEEPGPDLRKVHPSPDESRIFRDESFRQSFDSVVSPHAYGYSPKTNLTALLENNMALATNPEDFDDGFSLPRRKYVKKKSNELQQRDEFMKPPALKLDQKLSTKAGGNLNPSDSSLTGSSHSSNSSSTRRRKHKKRSKHSSGSSNSSEEIEGYYTKANKDRHRNSIVGQYMHSHKGRDKSNTVTMLQQHVDTTYIKLTYLDVENVINFIDAYDKHKAMYPSSKVQVAGLLSDDIAVRVANWLYTHRKMKNASPSSMYFVKNRRLIGYIERMVATRSPLHYIKEYKKAIKFHLKEGYKPSVQNFEPMFHALNTYKVDSVKVTAFMSKHCHPTYVPEINNKPDGWIHLFLSLMPNEIGQRIHKMAVSNLRAANSPINLNHTLRRIDDYLNPFFEVVDDIKRTNDLCRDANLVISPFDYSKRPTQSYADVVKNNRVAHISAIDADSDKDLGDVVYTDQYGDVVPDSAIVSIEHLQASSEHEHLHAFQAHSKPSDNGACFKELYGDVPCPDHKDGKCKYSHDAVSMSKLWKAQLDKLMASKYNPKHQPNFDKQPLAPSQTVRAQPPKVHLLRREKASGESD